MKAVILVIVLIALLIVGLAMAREDAPVPVSPVAAVAPAAPPAPGPGGFNPLQSDAVKDAIHRALRTGETQRWAEAGLSGYAVPSRDRLANGCRAVRYTIDQQPEIPYRSATACE